MTAINANRRLAARAVVQDWAGADASVSSFTRLNLPDMWLYRVTRKKPGRRGGGGTTGALVIEGKKPPLAGDDAMKHIIDSGARDPLVLAEVSLLFYRGKGRVIEGPNGRGVPSSLRNKVAPPALNGDELVYYALLSGDRGKRPARVEFHLRTLSFETQSVTR